MKNLPFWLTATAALVVVFLGVGVWYYYQLSNRVVWSMINVSDNETSADTHLLELPDGHTVLIDTGFGDSARRVLIPYLEQRGVDRIDQLVVTHARRNRYGGIVPLLENSLAIERIYFNLPSKTDCRVDSDCDYTVIDGARHLIERSGNTLQSLSTDELLYHNKDHDIILEVVYADTEAPRTPGGAGAMIRLIYGNTTVLFAGDVDGPTGDRLIDEHFFLDSTLLTTPLQGSGDQASVRFLDRVDPEAIMVSNGARQWHGRIGDRVRQFSLDRGIDTYVTGVHGNVVVALKQDGFNVSTERIPAKQ